MTVDDAKASRGATALPPVVFGIGATFVIWLRLGSSPFGKVWSEDGGVFLADFSAHGWRSLGYVYAGYVSVPSRAFAGVGAAALPLSLYATWCAIASAVVVGVLAAFVFASARRRIGWWALAPSLTMVLAPALRGESLGTFANLQGFLIAAACWAMPEQQVSGPIVALAAALSSPLVALALPLLVMRRATRAVIAVVIGLACQVVAIVIAPKSARPGVPRSVPSLRNVAGDVRLSLRLAVGSPQPEFTWLVLALLVGSLLVALVARSATRPLEAYLFAATAIALAAAATLPSPGAAYRYLAAPTVLLVSALALLDVPPRLARAAVGAAVVLVVVSFPVTAFRRSGPTWSGRACDGRTVAVVSVAPTGWGTATLICSGLR